MTDEERKHIEDCLTAVRRRLHEMDSFLEEIEATLAPPPDLDNAVAEGEEELA